MRLNVPRRRGGRAWVWLLVGLLAGGAAGAGAVWFFTKGPGKDGLPGGPRLGEANELAMVPADAAGFIHVRLRDAWRSDQFAGIRNIIEKAGPDAFKILKDNFEPDPSTIDRLTIVFLDKPDLGGGPPLPGLGNLPFDVPAPSLGGTLALLSFTQPFDQGRFRASALPAAAKKSVEGREVWADAGTDLAAHFPSDTVMVLGSVKPVEDFVRKQKDGKQPAGPLGPSLAAAAAGGHHLVAGFNLKRAGVVRPGMFDDLPGEMLKFKTQLQALAKVEAVAFGLALRKDDMRIDLRAAYASEEDAGAAEAAVKPLCDYAHTKLEEPRKMLRARLEGNGKGGAGPRPVKELPEAALYVAGLGALNHLDEYLQNPPVKREGHELVATFEVSGLGAIVAGGAAIAPALLLPAVQKVRDAAGRMQGSNNLKQIALAMHGYHDANGYFPPSAWTQAKAVGAKPGGLSWRVHLLPYLGHQTLYQQFKLDEAWDSPANKPLIELMPQVYLSPIATAPPGQTYYKVFVGRGAAFEADRKIRMTEVIDGTSNTILAIEGGRPVVWTKPDDEPFDPDRGVDLRALSLPGRPGINVALMDGSVRYIDLGRTSPQNFKAMITRNGGEVIGVDGDDNDTPFRPLGPKEGVVPKGFPKDGVPPQGFPKGGFPKGAEVPPPGK